MGRAHKLAGSRLSARTSLSPARILDLCAASAAAAVGNRWDGRTTTTLAGSTVQGADLEVRGGLGGKFKQLDFRVTVTPAGEGSDVATTITWYRTTQSVIAGFIPIGPKTMLGHHAYLQFVQDLAERLHAADPAASITVHKGVERIVSIDGAAGGTLATNAAPAYAAPLAPAPTPTPNPTATAVPTVPAAPAIPAAPGGTLERTCPACRTPAYDDDLFCGGCGTALPATTAETTGPVR